MYDNITNIDSLTKVFVGIGVLIFYLIGAFGAVKILKYLKKLNFKERPINSLIFLDEMTYLLLMSFDVANLLIILWTETSPPTFLKNYLNIELDEKVGSKTF
jgi:hypothetical protein